MNHFTPSETKAGKVVARGALGTIIFGLLALAITETLAEPDFFSYLNFGSFVWNHGFLPDSDPFSYLPTTRPWVYHEWLTAVTFAPLYQHLGAWPLQAGKYLAGFGAAGFLLAAARRRGAPFWAAGLGLLLAFPFFMDAFPPVLARIFTSLGFCVTIYACEAARTGTRLKRLWWLPAAFLLWANLHGGFPAGLAVLCCYAAGSLLSKQSPRPYLVLLAACLAATMVNPYGFGLWRAVLSHASGPDPEIPEWLSFFRSVAVLGWDLRSILFALLVLLLLPCLAHFFRNDRPALLVLIATALLGFSAVRHMALFSLAAACYLPTALAAAWEKPSTPRLKKAATMAFIGLLLLCQLGANGVFILQKLRALQAKGSPFRLYTPGCGEPGAGPYYYPVGAQEFLRERHLGGRLLTETIWGGFLTHSLYPYVQCAVDTRLETVFPPETRQAFFDFLFLRPGWQDFLAENPPDIIVIPDNRKLSLALSELGGFRLVYADRSARVFISCEKN